ncbi:MAG: hypothetical protein ACI9W2_003629 [Gammaproteobacteria bacterium]|jgi:hypothetical protein
MRRNTPYALTSGTGLGESPVALDRLLSLVGVLDGEIYDQVGS